MAGNLVSLPRSVHREETNMTTSDQGNRWNGPAGQVWVENRDILDTMFRPFIDILVAAVRAGDRVLDIGCGTGDSTLALARAVGPSGAAIGVDISEPMIAVARTRAAEAGAAAELLVADAETHDFAPDSFDAVVSRFGVMFFTDPVRAFANLRRACRADAAMTLIAWRRPDETPFMTAGDHAAAALLPDFAERRPGPSGQFAFADADHVRGILAGDGWGDIAISPIDVECAFPAGDLPRYVTRMGPLGVVLREMDADLRARVTDGLLAAFAPFVVGDQVRFTAGCWTITGKA